MEAGKACDLYGSLEGHEIQQSDAEQAYTQSKLGGDPTWVRLPREQWPASWKGMKDPVCPLILALHGHPDAGGYWEAHCESHLKSVGFVPIEVWRSCFWHAEWKMFLVVYVDDFKLAGPKSLMKGCWDAIRRGIRAEDPFPVGKYLGCDHVTSLRVDPKSGAKLRVMEHDMSDFMRSCVGRYVELAGVERSSLRKASTPFLAEVREPSPARDPMKSSDDLKDPAISPNGGDRCGAGAAPAYCRARTREGVVWSPHGSVRLVEGCQRACHGDNEVDPTLRSSSTPLDELHQSYH